MTPTIIALLMAATMPSNPVVCHGSGVIEHSGPPKTDLSYTGKEYIDRINNSTDGFVGDALLQDGQFPRIQAPEKLRPGGWQDMLQHIDDGSDEITATGGTGPTQIKMEWNRLSRILVLSTATGRWVGRCER